jgi:hypothetical protein
MCASRSDLPVPIIAPHPITQFSTVAMKVCEYEPEPRGNRKKFEVGNVHNARVGYTAYGLQVPQQAPGKMRTQ